MDETIDIRSLSFKKVGDVCNDYGALHIAQKDGNFYWSIENETGFDVVQEIPEELFHQLDKLDSFWMKKSFCQQYIFGRRILELPQSKPQKQ